MRRLANGRHHEIQPLQDIFVRHPQHPETQRLQVALPPSVVRVAGRIGVDGAVDLDHQPGLGAVHVHNVVQDAVLPPEPEPVELAAAEGVPEVPFGGRGADPEGAASVEEREPVVDGRHGERGAAALIDTAASGVEPPPVPLLNQEGGTP